MIDFVDPGYFVCSSILVLCRPAAWRSYCLVRFWVIGTWLVVWRSLSMHTRTDVHCLFWDDFRGAYFLNSSAAQWRTTTETAGDFRCFWSIHQQPDPDQLLVTSRGATRPDCMHCVCVTEGNESKDSRRLLSPLPGRACVCPRVRELGYAQPGSNPVWGAILFPLPLLSLLPVISAGMSSEMWEGSLFPPPLLINQSHPFPVWVRLTRACFWLADAKTDTRASREKR